MFFVIPFYQKLSHSIKCYPSSNNSYPWLSLLFTFYPYLFLFYQIVSLVIQFYQKLSNGYPSLTTIMLDYPCSSHLIPDYSYFIKRYPSLPPFYQMLFPAIPVLLQIFLLFKCYPYFTPFVSNQTFL